MDVLTSLRRRYFLSHSMIVVYSLRSTCSTMERRYDIHQKTSTMHLYRSNWLKMVTWFINIEARSNILNLNDELFPLISAAHWWRQAVCNSSNCIRCIGLDQSVDFSKKKFSNDDLLPEYFISSNNRILFSMIGNQFIFS